MKIIYSFIRVVIFLLSLFLSRIVSAQCAMCRASLESSEEVAQAQGINNGIVYLMVIPYILVIIVGYFIYQKMKKNKEDIS